jgi:hypothetical protein
MSFWIAVCGLLGVMPAAAGVVTPAARGLPPGYFIDAAQLAAERPTDRVEADGDFTLVIHRKYDTPLGAHLLDIAEALYPPREAIITQAIENESEIGSDSARTALWWQDGLGVSRVPYAVTAGAIAHYTGLTERFRAHDFRGAWDHNLFWTDFKYEATIEPRDHYALEDTTFTNVYVAEMALAWSYDDGTFVPECHAHRVVVLSKDGSVLYIQGDGYADEQVSMSSHRGIGRAQSLMR